MTTSQNTPNGDSIDDKVLLLFNEYTAELAFHGDSNLIKAISEAINHVSARSIFSGIELFEKALLEIDRITSSIPSSKLLPINPSAANRNPISDVTEYPISAALLEPIPDKLKGNTAAIMTMRCLLILSLLSNNQEKELHDPKSSAEQIRLATAHHTYESRKSCLDEFSKSLKETYGINQLLINISNYANELSDPLPRKLFQELTSLAGAINIAHKAYASIKDTTAFLDDSEDSPIEDVGLTELNYKDRRSFDEELDIPSDEPDDRITRFIGDDDETEEFLKSYTGSSTATKDILNELTVFSDANDDNRERQKGHWQYNTQSNLPYSTSLFNEVERSWLVDELKLGLTNKYISKCTLIVGLSICTVRTFDEVLDLTYGENGEITPCGTYNKLITSSDEAVVPAANEADLYHEHSDKLELELPALVKQLLEHTVICNLTEITLRQAIGYQSDEDEVSFSEFFLNIRNKYSSRFIIPRVKNQLKHFTLSVEKDPTLAYMLFGTKAYSPPIPNYYRFMPIKAVADKYKQYSSQYFDGEDI